MYPSYEEIRGEMRIRGLEGLIPDVYVCAVSTSVNEFRSLRPSQAHYKNHRTDCERRHEVPFASYYTSRF